MHDVLRAVNELTGPNMPEVSGNRIARRIGTWNPDVLMPVAHRAVCHRILSPLSALRRRGLVKTYVPVRGVVRYSLTDAGRSFLNERLID